MDRILRLRSLSYQRHANLQGTTALLLVHALVTLYYSSLSAYNAREDAHARPTKPVYDENIAGNGSIFMETFFLFWRAELFIIMKSFPNCLWIILLVLPFLQNPRWAGAWADGAFTLIFTLCCILLEYYGSGSHWMFGYVACGLIIRLMLYRHVWICLASTIAYLTAFRINIPEGEESKYSSFTFCIVQFSFISTIFYGIVTEKVYRSLCNRLWDHMHILLVLKEKAKRCNVSVKDVVSGHLCPVVIEHIFPLKLRDRRGNKISDGGSGGGGGGGIDDDDGSNTLLLGHTPPVVRSALRGKLIFDSKEARKESIHGLSSSDLKMLKGVDKRFCAIVAIRVCPRTGNEMISEHERFALNAVIDEIARRHKVAHVRNYGTTWVGCAGFFEHDDVEEDASENELGTLSSSRLGASLSAQFLVWETLMMTFEVHAVMKHLNHRVIVAMEANKIIGGFLGKTPSFDFFGSEIRWVLRVTQEFPLYDDTTTLLGAGVRSILQARGRGGGAKGDQPLEFVSRRFAPASSNHAAFQTTEQAYTLSVSGLTGAKNCAFVSETSMRRYVSLHAEQGGDLQWIDGYKNLFSEYNALLQSQSDDVLNAAVNSEEDEIKKILTEWSFEVVSSDFLNHCDPKYRAILQDPILDQFSDEQILDWHKSSLHDVQEMIRRHYFSSYFHYCALIKKEDWIGWNDWRPNTIDRLMGRELSSESCEPAAPFEVIKSLLAAIHIRIPFLPPEKGTTTTSNQNKYETQKSSTQHCVLPGKSRPKKVVPNNSDLLSSAARNQNKKAKSAPATNEKSRDKMNFTEFRREVMLVSSNPLITACAYAVFFMCTIYCFESFPSGPNSYKGELNYSTTIYGFMWGLMLSKISIQRNFDGISYALQAWMVFFGCYKFPVSDAMCRAPNALITSLGDSSGESIMFAYIAMIFAADVRIPLSVLMVLNCAGAMGINLPNRSTIDCGGASGPHRLQMTTYMSLTFAILRWIMDYTVYLVFIVETELTPASLRFYQADLVDARNLLLLFEPALKHEHNESLVLPRKYPECTVITVNVKASAFLAGILDCKQFETIYGQVSAIINKSIAEFGLLKVTEFAGIVTIVECKELSDRYLRAIYRETSRTAFFLKTLQQRVEDYAVANKFNVELDIGIDHGPAMVGLLGGRTHSLDLTGRTRDFSQIISSLSLAVSGKAQTIISGSFAADMRAMRHFSTHFVMRPASLLYRASRLPIHLVEQAFSGMTLDDFDLIAMLGRGGYGSVHLVREVKTAQLYAVKVIPQKASLMASVLDHEFRALQRLNYPNVVSFKYSLMNDAKVYLFMNYVEGGTLQQVVDKYEPPVAHLTFWFAELTLAIEYVHSVGILHRDVKPANCMIGTDGHLRLCDFGLSKSIPKENSSGSTSMSRTTSSSLLGNSTEKNPPLDPETLRTLERLMPVKSRLQENFKEASYSILLVPLNLSQTPVSAPSHKALLDMFFSVTLAASFDDAKALLANQVKAEVVIIELGSFLGTRGAAGAAAAATAVGGAEQDGREELLELLRACLREINAPGSAFKDLPIMVLSSPSFFEEKTQQSLKREFLPLKHFLNAPLSFYDRATLMYFGRMARNALSDNEFMDKLAQHLQSTAASPALSDTFPANFPANLARKEPDNIIVRAGTALFMAPEIILRGEYSKAIDWWACGVSFYYCTTRSYLVNCSTTADAMRKISKVEMDVSALRPYSPPLEDLVRGLLNRDVSERLGTQNAQQIRNHAFFKHLNWTTFQLVPPFKPDAELQTRVKNIPLFYGNTFRPKHRQGGPAPEEPETNNSMSRSSERASLKMTKTIAKQQLKQELVRFSSLQSMRESWIRQSAEGSKESFKEQRARRGGGADGEDAFTGSFGMSFFQQDSCMSIQEEREGSKGSGSRGSGSESAGNIAGSSRDDRGKLEFL